MKQDHKLVASKENNGSEVKYIARTFKIPIKVVRQAALEVGVNGQPGRSREEIYDNLRGKGFVINVKQK